MRLGVLALVVTAVLAVPAVADAATYTVNSTATTADAATNGVCDDGAGNCTLVGAIQESNASTTTDDTINFSAAFNGVAAGSTIFPATASTIPTITDTVLIDGGQCGAGPDPEPCTGLEGTGSSSFFGLTAGTGSSGTVIRRIAFTNLLAGVGTNSTSSGVVVTGSWFGADLDESVTGNQNGSGVTLNGTSHIIGGTTVGERNWFARNSVGAHIFGGDSVTVQGNYFGTSRTGAGGTAAGFMNTDSVVVDAVSPDTASNNNIGSSDPSGFPNTDCDGPCNLFGFAADDHIDLRGTSGGLNGAVSTIIRGNFIGVGLTGADNNAVGASSGRAGIDLGAPNPATATTIGGPGDAGRNFIGGNPEGIRTNELTDSSSVIQKNWIGMQPDGTGAVPNDLQGILVSAGTTGSIQLLDNRVAVANSTGASGIYAYGRNTILRRNVIGIDDSGAVIPSLGTGVDTQSSTTSLDIGTMASGQGNTIGGMGIAGIRLNGAFGTDVVNNFIGTDSTETADYGNTGPGILVTGTPGVSTPSIIGDFSAANVISNNGGDAIRVDRVPGVEIRYNRGSNNDEQFIDLMNPAGSGNSLADGAAEGLQAPVITSFNSATIVSGTSAPNATVYVFAKSSDAAGELGADLGSDTANGSGAWSVTIPAQSDGQRIVALQSSFSTITPFGLQSSELSSVAQIDTVAPVAPTITGTDPGTPANDDTPNVKGTAEAGSTVRLYTDATCTGTVFAQGTDAAFLSPGLTSATIPTDATTTFRATATDAAGNPSPCSAPFTYVEDSTGPTTNITAAPSGTTSDNTPTVTFTASEGTSSCSVDGGMFTACTSPATFGPLADGAHTIAVKSTDAVGNDGATVTASFTIDTTPPPVITPPVVTPQPTPVVPPKKCKKGQKLKKGKCVKKKRKKK